MGWFDGLFSGIGDIFGGGGGGDWGTLTPFDAVTADTGSVLPMDITSNVSGLFDSPSYLSGVGDFFSGASSYFPDMSSFQNMVSPLDVTGGGTVYDWSTMQPFDAVTAGGGGVSPANNIFSSVPGLINTPGLLGAIGPLLGGGGGGGGPPPQMPHQPAPQQGPTQSRPLPNQGGPPLANTGGAGGGGGIGDFLGGLTGALPGILSAAGLFGGLLKGNKLPPEADTLRKNAANFGNLGQRAYDTAVANQQGMINDQATNQIQRTLRQNEAGIRGAYGGMGMTGSTMEQQDLADARARAQQQVFATGQEMATQGLSSALSLFGDQSGILQGLMSDQIAQDKDLSDAIAQFASAAVSSLRPGTTVNVGANAGGLPPGYTSQMIDPTTLAGATPIDPSSILSSIISPQAPVQLPDISQLVSTPASLPDLSSLMNQDQIAATDFLQPFLGMQ